MFFLPRFFSKKARNFTIFFFDSLATLSTCRRSANSKRNSLNTALIFHIRSVQFWLAENSVTQLRNLKKFCRSFSWSTCRRRQIFGGIRILRKDPRKFAMLDDVTRKIRFFTRNFSHQKKFAVKINGVKLVEKRS